MESANCKKCKYYVKPSNWFSKVFCTAKCKYKPIEYTNFYGKQKERYVSCSENKHDCPFY